MTDAEAIRFVTAADSAFANSAIWVVNLAVIKLLQVTLIGLFLLTGACGPIMPEGFRNLAIGMTWKEVIEARPDAEILKLMPDPGEELTPDPEEPRNGLSEMINTGPIKLVVVYLLQFRKWDRR